MPTAVASPPVYRATRNADGTRNIHDVPIMCLLDVGDSGQETDIDEAWLTAAVANAQRREKDDHYLAPLHVHHHDDGEDVRLVGFMRLRRVGDYSYEGQPTKAVFADLVNIRPEVFEEIKKLALPYRSVEILDARKKEIDSLALLAHHVPFFRLALLRVADGDDPAAGEDGFALVRKRVCRRLALARRGSQYSILCSAERMEVRMDEDKTDDVKAEDTPDIEIEVDENKKDDVKAEDGGGMEAKLDAILALLQKLVGADDAGVAPGMGAAPAEPEAMAAAFAARRAAKAKAADKALADENATLKAEVAALKLTAKKGNADAAKKASVEARAAKARAALAGYDLDEQDERDIVTLAALGDKAVDAFVAAIKRRTAADPDPTLDAALVRAGAGEQRSASADPAKLEAARKDWLRLRGNGSRATFEAFVEANADIYGIEEPVA